MTETVATQRSTQVGAELASRYDPHEVEARWVARWARQPFTADPTSGKPPFTVVIPPPNVTGALHLGHAFDNSIIDTLVRFKRMQGYEALFQPGTDHAGIATQVQVERALKAEGTSRFELGRARFLERVWQWREKYGGVIIEQLQRLGISASWDRTRFTMDEGLSAAVRLQFVKLFSEGKVYRKERIVNWDPVSQTVLSDLEVDREDRQTILFELAYELEGGGDVRIATARPETIFADTAVAVHPDDERYAGVIGKRARIPLTDRWIPVIADEAVEIGFGTGALKVTPAHDPLDYEIGERHGLEMPSVIDLEAKLIGDLVPAEFRGRDRFEVRPDVVAALEAAGAVVGRRDHLAPIGLSQRTGQPVEPLLSLQWFYDTDPGAAAVLAGLDAGDTRFTPERFGKVNRDWLGNLRHWCISRQLWWGHRIPAWYDPDGNIYVPSPDAPDLDPPDDPRYAGLDLRQDEDVFDTWFSSNLWPFSTLGWPDEEDPFYRKFYPTSVLVTGYDILAFWVARMQIAGYEFTGQAPFADVLLHGLVLDAKGQKMSKSKNNGIDPLEAIGEYGADALRFALTRAATGGQDVRWDDRQLAMGRNFCTKLWNAARFASLSGAFAAEAGGSTPGAAGGPGSANLADRWILSRLQTAVREVTASLEEFDLGAANRALYEFVWSELCDWYLEAAKPGLRASDAGTAATLAFVLRQTLKLLHPLVPFVTSELHQTLGAERQIAWEEWPVFDAALVDEEAEREFGRLQEAVTAARALRAEAEIDPAARLSLEVSGPAASELLAQAGLFEPLARASLSEASAVGAAGANLSRPLAGLELTLPLAGQVDLGEYVARQRGRLAKVEKELERSSHKLAQERFVANAPAEVVEEERRRLAEAEDVKARLETLLGRLERAM